MSRCPQCRHENPDDAKFCLECGRRLALGARPAAPSSRPARSSARSAAGRRRGPSADRGPVEAPPESYTPKHLAEKILTSKAALEGERKQVTVLFADLKGSMELLADRDPEEARKLLDPVLERMMEAVHRYEGTVNQVMGDGIMALFGAPLAHEDHAVRACYAALRMQEAVRQLRRRAAPRARASTVQIRVGLNSGEVVVRSIGSDLRMDYTAVGQTTHLAARMEQLATPGSDPAHRRRRCAWPRATSRSSRSARCRSRGWASRSRSSSCSGPAPPARASRPRRARGLTRFVGRERGAGAAPRRPRAGRAAGTARWSPWSASPAWASRGWSGSSATPTARRAGWCWRAARSPTARPPPTCP